MSKQTVLIGIANDGEVSMEVEVLKKWEPKNISRFGDTVYFKNEDTYFSMKRVDFDNIFTTKQ